MFQIIVVILLFIIALAVAPTLVAVAMGLGAAFLGAWFVKFVLSVVIGTVVAIGILIYFLMRNPTPPPLELARAKSRETLISNNSSPSPLNENAWLALTADAIRELHSSAGGRLSLSFCFEGGEEIARWTNARHRATLFVSPHVGWTPFTYRNPNWLEKQGFKSEGSIYQKQFDPANDWDYPELSRFIAELFKNVFAIRRVQRVQVNRTNFS